MSPKTADWGSSGELECVKVWTSDGDCGPAAAAGAHLAPTSRHGRGADDLPADDGKCLAYHQALFLLGFLCPLVWLFAAAKTDLITTQR